MVTRIVSVNPATQVDALDLNQNAWSDDHHAGVDRMAGVTAGGREAEGAADSEAGHQHVPEESQMGFAFVIGRETPAPVQGFQVVS